MEAHNYKPHANATESRKTLDNYAESVLRVALITPMPKRTKKPRKAMKKK